ncbi:hypothetical protein BLA34_12725 [Ralstonia solanacearum]|nr:hypothetical protein BLA34_12725 [Ralstonia solanacearum]
MFFAAVATGIFLLGNRPAYSYKENSVPNHVELSPRLQALFSKTKLVCFGRYVLEVPQEAELSFGFQEFPGKITTYVGAKGKAKSMAEAFREKVLHANATAEVKQFGPGKVPGSWQVYYFANADIKEFGGFGAIRNFVESGDHVFEWGFSENDGEKSIQPAFERAAYITRNLRARDNADVPVEPGVCIDHGFIRDDTGKFQEIFSAGIHMPSLPDVSFSVLSNKNASTKDGNGDGLIQRHERAMSDQGVVFSPVSKMARLRIGNNAVNGWKGEEVLLKHRGKANAFAHEFLWASVGQTGNALNPASVDIRMYTGTDAGATFQRSSSLTDDEAVALWDKLLSGVRFRVNAPPTATGSGVTAHSGQPCPKTGKWKPTISSASPSAAIVSNQSALTVHEGVPLPAIGLAASEEAQVVWTWIGE